ncbi:MAG: hypothetical protein Q9220_003168 [cf. Caloplaca sp. 1 TL-2023]
MRAPPNSPVLMIHRSQVDKAFGERNGCQPMETKLPYKWPLALDILKRQYDAFPSQRLLAFQTQFIEKMPNMELRLFGQVGYLVTDPRIVESMLSSRFEDWIMGSRSDGLRPLLGEGIFTQDGLSWKHSRDLLRRQFVRINLRDPSIFEEHVNQMLATLKSSKGAVDLQPAFFRLTLATTTALIFGKPISDLDDKDHADFGKSFDYASLISAFRIRLADLCWIYKPRDFVQACNKVHAYAHYFVKEAIKSTESKNEGLASEGQALILDLHNELKDELLVRDQLMHVLIAGRDTTACLLSWALWVKLSWCLRFADDGSYLLVRHPAVLDKLRREISDVIGDDRQISRSAIQHMIYLRCVINEKDFALMEASYTIIRVIQAFPNLRLPPGEPQYPTGQERQSLTIVVSSAEGCRVLLD